VRLDLQVLAKLSANEVYFDKLMQSLVTMFRSDRKLLDLRGNLIVRQLSLSIKPEKIYRALALILEPEVVRSFPSIGRRRNFDRLTHSTISFIYCRLIQDTDFASTFIQTLNIILLTSTELVQVRLALKNLTVQGETNEDIQSLFVVLYRCATTTFFTS